MANEAVDGKLPSHGTPAGVKVHLLDGGSLSTATLSILHADAGQDKFRLYDWCFCIFHEPSRQHVLWDLGCATDVASYTPWVQQVMLPLARPVGPRKSVPEQLKDLGVTAADIKTVLFSHAHWDHCRPISAEFPNATAFFGPGTKDFCSPGNMVDGQPDPAIEWDGRYFDVSGHATERWEELSGQWIPFGPFEKALDFFNDGSFWIIDAPGHMPGNLCAAARLDGTSEWVLLGSDCCHSQALLDQKAKVACYTKPDGQTAAYLHMDLPAAEDTMQKLRIARSEYGMHIALAHDASWMISGADQTLMTLLGKENRGEWLDKVRRNEQP